MNSESEMRRGSEEVRAGAGGCTDGEVGEAITQVALARVGQAAAVRSEVRPRNARERQSRARAWTRVSSASNAALRVPEHGHGHGHGGSL
jgi:hypothetical protein